MSMARRGVLRTTATQRISTHEHQSFFTWKTFRFVRKNHTKDTHILFLYNQVGMMQLGVVFWHLGAYASGFYILF
jgi:hypothetical protein